MRRDQIEVILRVGNDAESEMDGTVDDETEDGWEGCLSVPDMRGLVSRYCTIQLDALDGEGNPIKLVASGFHARVIQHETDHLNGLVYLDRMRDMTSLCYTAEWQKHWLASRTGDEEPQRS